MASKTFLDRDKRAALLVHDWAVNGLSGERMLAELHAYASEERFRDFTPHLMTAVRCSHLWYAIRRAQIEACGEVLG